MNVTVIRFEGPLAICRKESKAILTIKRGLIPLEAEEGDVLEICGSTITRDLFETKRRKKRIEELLNEVLA